MRFKGQTVKGPKKQYTLREQLGQGGFSIIYSTNDSDSIAKVQVLKNPQICAAYQNEKSAMSALKHHNIVQLKDSFEIKEKDGEFFGFLIMENCSHGNSFNLLQMYEQKEMPEKLVLKILYATASALEYMHSRGFAHRDIKMENVLQNSKGQFKLCDFGSSSKEVIKVFTKQNRTDIEQNIQKTTTPFYRAPEQLDLYSDFEIGCKVDVFALGVLAFMLCFQKPPFQSRLSAINKQYFIPQETSYSTQLISLVEDCFTTNPAHRPSAQRVKSILKGLIDTKVAQIDINLQRQFDNTLMQFTKINSKNMKVSSDVAQTGFFDKIKRIYNQITTETEGWIAGFAQDNQHAPALKYNRSLISKCWQKRYKAQKLYEIIHKYSEESKAKSLVTVKLLILLHNFLRKGPPESVSYDGIHSSHKICSKIYKNWKLAQKSTDSVDIKRNSYLCLIIRYYSLILIAKWKMCYQNSDLIQGNYSILPFLNAKKEVSLLKIPFIEQLLSFLNFCVEFHIVLNKNSYLVQIQRSIILSLVDQEYCLLSLLVFLICGFKEALCYLDHKSIDMEKLQKKIKFIQTDFQTIFSKITRLFQSVSKLASLFEDGQQNSFLLLNPKIPSFIKQINIRQRKQGQFELNKHINYSRSIHGLKIPLSYQEAVKNPNYLKALQKKVQSGNKSIQINQFLLSKDGRLMAKQPSQVSQKCEKSINSNDINAPTNFSNNKQDAFKKNKQKKVFSNDPFSGVGVAGSSTTSPSTATIKKATNKQTSKNAEQSAVQAMPQPTQGHLMQFTHQNLNSDMNQAQIQREQQTKNNSNQSSSSYKDKTVTSSPDNRYTSINDAPNDNRPGSTNSQQHFKDFLSIVDDKYAATKSPSAPMMGFANFDSVMSQSSPSPVKATAKGNKSDSPGAVNKTQTQTTPNIPTNPNNFQNQPTAKTSNINNQNNRYNSFASQNTVISAVPSSASNNKYLSSQISLKGGPPIVCNEDDNNMDFISSVNDSARDWEFINDSHNNGNNLKPNTNLQPHQYQPLQRQKQHNDSVFYSSISSLSKDVYNSLNPTGKQSDKQPKKSAQQVHKKKPETQVIGNSPVVAKGTATTKMELMNFFDDQEQETPKFNIDAHMEKHSQKQVQNVVKENNHILNRTDTIFGNGRGRARDNLQQGGSQKVLPPPHQKQFKTASSPTDYSFIDLRGFIVEEVRKNADQYFIDFPSLKFHNKVGFGHSSEVFKGEWRGREVAIKRIKDNMSPSNAKEFKREIMTSVKIRHHPNLVTLIGIAEYQNEYYIINEFCNGATLFDFLHESSFQIPIAARLSVAQQIAKGMVFLHTNDPPIIHRDLKSLNVLLVNKYNGQAEPQIKIADFGLSRDFASTYMTGTLGTYHWMAPEIFNNEPYSLKADVYSFGIVLWEILARAPPYTNLKNPQSLMKFITLQNGRPDLNLVQSDCPYQLRMLMIRCWDRFPENRPSFKEILSTLNNIKV